MSTAPGAQASTSTPWPRASAHSPSANTLPNALLAAYVAMPGDALLAGDRRHHDQPAAAAGGHRGQEVPGGAGPARAVDVDHPVQVGAGRRRRTAPIAEDAAFAATRSPTSRSRGGRGDRGQPVGGGEVGGDRDGTGGQPRGERRPAAAAGARPAPGRGRGRRRAVAKAAPMPSEAPAITAHGPYRRAKLASCARLASLDGVALWMPGSVNGWSRRIRQIVASGISSHGALAASTTQKCGAARRRTAPPSG